MQAFMTVTKPGATTSKVVARRTRHDTFTVEVNLGAAGILHLDDEAARKLLEQLRGAVPPARNALSFGQGPVPGISRK